MWPCRSCALGPPVLPVGETVPGTALRSWRRTMNLPLPTRGTSFQKPLATGVSATTSYSKASLFYFDVFSAATAKQRTQQQRVSFFLVNAGMIHNWYNVASSLVSETLARGTSYFYTVTRQKCGRSTTDRRSGLGYYHRRQGQIRRHTTSSQLPTTVELRRVVGRRSSVGRALDQTTTSHHE